MAIAGKSPIFFMGKSMHLKNLSNLIQVTGPVFVEGISVAFHRPRFQVSHEKEKPWLFRLYKGLYYPLLQGLIMSDDANSPLNNQYFMKRKSNSSFLTAWVQKRQARFYFAAAVEPVERFFR